MQLDQKINWAILVTGWGKNAKDTIEAYTNGKLKKSVIRLLIYEDEPCGAKEFAETHNIEVLQLKRKEFLNQLSYQNQLIEELKKRDINFIFLLNYKYIIKNDMLAAFPNSIVNIHPSLFPSFLATKTAVQDALAYGVKVTGITTHIIDSQIDKGTIICQTVIKVKENDTFDTIYPKFAKKGKKIIIKTIKLIEEHYYNFD
jgi:phosphoribosylglycinamide formyltransferase-1